MLLWQKDEESLWEQKLTPKSKEQDRDEKLEVLNVSKGKEWERVTFGMFFLHIFILKYRKDKLQFMYEMCYNIKDNSLVKKATTKERWA